MDLNYKWIVYLTVNTVNKKTYIGVHKTHQNDFDGYIGCGVRITQPCTYKNPKTPFQYAVKKYGVDAFIRTTLFEYDNLDDAYQKESEIVDEQYVRNPNTYNMILGGRKNTEQANPKKEVHMYDKTGEYIRSFDSCADANRFLNPNAIGGGHISRNIRQGFLTKGYQFSYEKLPYMKQYEKPKNVMSEKAKNKLRSERSKSVGRYTQEGELIETYPSLKACRKAGYNNARLVIIGERNHCHGFIFKYLENE